MRLSMEALIEVVGAQVMAQVDVIAGVEARGFHFATMLQQILKKPQVMLRKPSKTPGDKVSASYGLEYGKDALELELGLIQPGQRVLIVDDLLATAAQCPKEPPRLSRKQAVFRLCFAA